MGLAEYREYLREKRKKREDYRETLSLAGSSKPSVHQKMFQYTMLSIVGLIFFGLFMVWYMLLGPSNDHPGSFYNRNENAIWAQHAWVDQPHTPTEIRNYVELLGFHGVRDVYLHVGPIDSDGGIPPERYKELSNFLSVSRQYGDRIRFLAWMGQLRSKLPLQDNAVRRRIVQTAQTLIHDYGMDGIHYDIEPIVDDDTEFLYLLEDTKKAIGEDKILSVALPELIPDYVFRLTRKIIDLKSYLASDYYHDVAERSDQVAVMTYENSIKQAWLYRYFIKNEVIWLTQLFSDLDTKVIIGLPTYDKASETFYPDAENIESGLLGVIDGLNSWRSENDSFQGVALYGSWTTDEKEWQTLEKLFLKKM